MFLEAPEWLLTAPVAAVWAAWWWRRRATGLPAGTSGVSLALWVLAACAVAVAASGPRIREARPVPVEVVVLVDGSESMQGPALDRARRVAGEIAAAAPAEAASVRRGTFARGLAWDGVEATLDASSTDAGRAVSLAAALPSSGARRRIALVTDANDTSGAVRTAAAAARAAGVPVHVVAIGETAPELVVASLDVPRAVRRGRTFAAGVRVAGTRPGRLACSLAVGSAPPIERAADFAPPGATLRWGGLAVPAEAHDRLSVRVECRGGSGMDTWPQNNARQETVEITGAMRAWCLDLVAPPAPVPAPVPARAPAAATAPSRPGPGPQCATLARLLGDTADVVPVGPEEVRRLATATPRPDVLVLGNTGPGVLPPVAEPLAEAVRTGVGVLFLGGERALSLAGLGGTAIERDLLPVFLTRREEESVPERAVVMVLDRSSSMTGQKIALARESAIASARALPKETLLGVIAFDSQPYVILKPGPVGDASRAAAALAAITPSGGTDILKALRAARAMIEPVRAVQRVVVLLTDGASNPKDVVETAASMGREGVQVSTIAVGPEPDRQLLARVAEATGGRHYWARSAEAVPRLLLAEVTGGENAPAPDGKRSVVPASTPIARRVFRGVDPARLVPIDGLDHTQERPEGVAVAATETGEPIAAVRRVGAGQAAAFTPGLEDRWAGAFLAP
ncbi:MAG: VWA domain-containing protein, partial [Deltaproteobacteria bacterium]|nr:VWA domain-containing protein [Deltaproteobacteria bacterium]